MGDLSFILIVAGISLVVGLMVGLMVNQLRKGPKLIEDTDQERDFKPVIEIGRSRNSEAFIIKMGNSVYEDYNQLTAGKREALIQAHGDLETWMDVVPDELLPEPVTPDELQPDPVAPDELLPEPESPDWLPVEDFQEPDQVSPESFKGGMNPFEVVTKALQADVGNPDLEPVSIASQIDEILQEIIAGTPLAERGVRLMELPEQGLVVMVGMEKFGKVDEVEDPEVKEAIKQAVEAWEARSSEE